MYRRILGFFGGAMSEGSEENQEVGHERDNEGRQHSETGMMASGDETAALRAHIDKLEKQLKEQIEQNESYKNRLHSAEQEIAILRQQLEKLQPAKTSSIGVGENNVHSGKDSVTKKKSASSEENSMDKVSNENIELRDTLNKTNALLKEKTDLCENQGKQNVALANQVTSLKEVVAITKDLLNIRNMEVRHLQSDVDSMEGKITEEKQRHNSMIVKMDEAVKLNSELKTEYETQLKIFQDLKSKYEEKVKVLTKENQKLEGQLARSAQEPVSDNQVTNNDTIVPE